MAREELQESLDRLRAEITKLGDDDQPVKGRMEGLVAELERQLETSEDGHGADLLDSLTEHIEHFEVEHPRLTGVLNRIMAALSDMGI